MGVWKFFSVRATSLLCLLGVGLGIGSVLLYRVYTRLFGGGHASPYDHLTPAPDRSHKKRDQDLSDEDADKSEKCIESTISTSNIMGNSESNDKYTTVTYSSSGGVRFRGGTDEEGTPHLSPTERRRRQRGLVREKRVYGGDCNANMSPRDVTGSTPLDIQAPLCVDTSGGPCSSCSNGSSPLRSPQLTDNSSMRPNFSPTSLDMRNRQILEGEGEGGQGGDDCDIDDDKSDVELKDEIKSYSAPPSTKHTYRSNRLLRSESRESVTLGGIKPLPPAQSTSGSSSKSTSVWNLPRVRSAQETYARMREGSLSPVATLSSSGSEPSYLRMLGKRQLFRAQTQGHFINDIKDVPYFDLSHIRRASSEFSDTFSGITTPDSELFDPGDVGVTTSVTINKIETELDDLQKELEEMELGMKRLTSRDNTPAKDLGFHSDASSQDHAFQRTLCVLHRHRRKKESSLTKSRSMSDGEDINEKITTAPAPVISATTVATAVSPPTVIDVDAGGDISSSSPNASRRRPVLGELSEGVGSRYSSNRSMFRRSIHSDNDYVWEYCPEVGISTVESSNAAVTATTIAADLTAAADSATTAFSDDDTFQSAPSSITDLSYSISNIAKASTLRSRSPPLSVIKNFLVTPQPPSPRPPEKEHRSRTTRATRSHNGSRDSGVSVSPQEEVDPHSVYTLSRVDLEDVKDRGRDLSSDVPQYYNVDNDIGSRLEINEYINRRCPSITSIQDKIIRDGYESLRLNYGVTYISICARDHYNTLRGVTYQSLLLNANNIKNTLPTKEQAIKDLTCLISSDSSFLKDWFLFHLSNIDVTNAEILTNVIISMANECLTLLYDLISDLQQCDNPQIILNKLIDYRNGLVSSGGAISNDTLYMEAIKLLMLLYVHNLYKKKERNEDVSSIAWLLFTRESSCNPQKFFLNHLNNVGYKKDLGKMELFLLANTLHIDIRLFNVCNDNDNDESFCEMFNADYPGVPTVNLVTENDTHYNVLHTT